MHQLTVKQKRIVIIIISILWVLNPIDGDWIPVLGWLDDIIAILIAVRQVAKIRQENVTKTQVSERENDDIIQI